MALENYVKFLRGTPSQYENLTNKDKDTLYFISEKNSESGILYLGNKIIAGAGQPETITLNSLKDVIISETGIENNSLLIYDEELKNWVNKPIDEILYTFIEIMKGATPEANGFAGLVPAPKAGEQEYFLRGDGTWSEVYVESQTKVFEIVPKETEDHIAAINRVVGITELNSGDIAIIKELIAYNKYQHTAYIYYGKWKAMDGNYNAKNVYFDENLLTTSAVGEIELINGQATIPAAGKNLKEVFNTIFVKEKNPEIVNPTLEISLLTPKKYEVGKEVEIIYSSTFDEGSYSYGPTPTNVSIYSYEITDGITVKDDEMGTFSNVLVTDDMNYRLMATVKHKDGAIPVTNLGNPYTEGQIKAASVIGYSDNITSYRPFFYGMSDVLKEEIVYNSSFIRGLINGGDYDSRKILTFNAADLKGVKRFVIAIPKASLRKGISSAIITSSMNVNVLEFYEELDTTIDVKGADGYIKTVPYRVWVYEPVSIAAEEIHEVVLQ